MWELNFTQKSTTELVKDTVNVPQFAMLCLNMRVPGKNSSPESHDRDTSLYAVLDLGSNSFHLMVLSQSGSSLEVLERVKEKVQLAHDMADGQLSQAAMDRGLACLARFAQRLRAVPPENIRVVGTSALREACNREAFTRVADAILGRNVTVISGREEARLIYLGVDRIIPGDDLDEKHPRLVIDIGGGSTEFARGDHSGPGVLASLGLGCVRLMDQCFLPAVTPAAGYTAARERVAELLAGLPQEFRLESWHQCLGTSGTIESIQRVLDANGWGTHAITRAGMQQLEQGILDGRWVLDISVPGLERDRSDIFPAGVAILAGIFEHLALTELRFAPSTLTEGVFFDALAGPMKPSLRQSSIEGFGLRFQPDRRQVARVRATALSLYQGVAETWALDNDACRDLLNWAVELHEIGLKVNSTHYHRHGAYLIQNGDLWGFGQQEKQAISLLIRSHRRAFQTLSFGAYEEEWRQKLKYLCILLRLAVILQRGRCDASTPRVSARVQDPVLYLYLPKGWLSDNALSERELEVEARQLRPLGVHLKVSETPTEQ